MRSVRDLKPFFVQLDLDSSPTWSGLVYQVSVGNGRYHGGGLKVAENASIDDGRLDLYLIYPGRLWQLATSLIHLKFGTSKPEVLQRLTAVSVSLRTNRPRPVDADGELVTKTPTQFGLHPRALTVIVPHKGPLDSPS
jgi:diacylglycerol kinase family enzyme